ncbi:MULTISPECIES: TetM/TetW/TetO/TetS family tetracycline resistance ribosomal protection protein [Lactococcus]|uniref:Tetracycline resistance ribosomal protection mosaic protein Tet(O/W/32/O) n=1 Tax=Lactococcus petauri TaxID=1940789 RepID=A0AAJ2MN26_9LACT|nr:MULTISPECIES: TetM/TetW/TetO/TetS family tetracycline resistance ribosomal protection protein [Lactococcus]MCO7181563.1 tetracycline resistance ribosomal protection mosaic protein Tet(O/W/32/O) [Lactococcus formosensis]MDT2528180.1 tetracycline resistance ribosomal protection mosaic protein Tet(O/W/32/O) [Lactococcus petauri]MDT2542679.1 tetracycline resistance ribosomal protection mosaic protein Tet(O/W/32/O) [Lactococcus petauri]MDT2552999.1 tetracycline resistance ribosomal protection mos
MKIINLGILAHVDAGKTTLTESLLYTSGAIAELGSVDEGTTRTDTMNLERQRGITIQTAVTSFQWEDVKVNIIDTPGHMDFLAEVYRSLAVLDGAILVISAKDGVQAQTRILFHALRKMNIPTVIFINKIDQAGVDLQSVVQSVRDKLSADIIIKQTVSLSPEIVLEENTDIEAWDAVIENNDKLLEKYIAGEPISREKLVREEQRRVQDASLFPVYYGSAKKGLGIQPLMDAVTGLFQPIGEQGSAALCGSVFKVEYTDCGQRRVYLRLYSGTLRLRDTVALAGREKLKITEMRIPSKGEIVRTDTAYPGEIVILADDTLKLNEILGNEKLLPHKTRIDNPMPLLRTTVEPQKPEQREALLNALAEIADTDPLLHFDIDTVTHEIMLSFLGKVQLEVICSLLEEKYHVGVAMKEPSVIYLERPLRKAEYTIHIEVPPNPFWASVGLSIEPLPIGSGVQYESRVSLGYLNQSFQNAVMEGVLYGCEQGLYGWKVTDCKICFEYGLYYSPVSTPADFRLLSPIVLEQALKKAGTELLEPYLHFEIYAPQEYLSRAYHDAPRYCADIVSTQIKNDEVILKGEIPARCIQEYRNDLTNFTNGQGVCLTELKGYQPAIGKFICQPRRPNSRIDKVRHMFHKLA